MINFYLIKLYRKILLKLSPYVITTKKFTEKIAYNKNISCINYL